MSTCDAAGTCACTDRKCDTTIAPPISLGPESTSFASASSHEARQAVLTIACDGSVMDVLLLSGTGTRVFHDEPLMVLHPSVALPRQMAARD